MKTAAVLLLSALAVSACTDKAGDKKPASQIAARVNDAEISIHQVNFVLQRTPAVPADQADATRRQILDSLVDQELAVQQALAAKLDRDPKVMQTMEAARRDILARAFMERTLTGTKQPSAEAVRAYYKEHPELFANRKVYRLQEIGFAAAPDFIAGLRDQLAKSGRGDQVVNALRAKGIRLTGSVVTKAAENVSLDILPRLAQMKAGESALFDEGGRASIITVMDTTSQPLGEEAAKPYIEQFLRRRQESELSKATLQQLRDNAKIVYVGEFGAEAEAAKKAREAEAAQKAEADRQAREAARLAAASDAARQAEAAKKAREAADATRDKSPGRLPAPPDSTVSKGITLLK